MEVKINREIRDYTESMFFGLSMRQFFFSVFAMGIAVQLLSKVLTVTLCFFTSFLSLISERKRSHGCASWVLLLLPLWALSLTMA